MEQHIRFCRTPNAERMAYAVSGEGPPLIVVPGWVSHLQVHWDGPPHAVWEALSQHHTLIRYDKPGTGLSDRDFEDAGLDARVADLTALIDHLEYESVDVMGWSEGGPTAVMYAHRYPDKVGRLVLYGSFAKFPHPRELVDAMISLVRAEWGVGSAALSAAFVPSGDPAQVEYFTKLQRAAATRETAAELIALNITIDVREEASELALPVLVLHREGDKISPLAGGRELAATVPGADFVTMPGEDHTPWLGDSQAWLNAVEKFLRPDGHIPEIAQAASSAGAFKTVIFTDLVGHTEMMSRLGDEIGREVLREHERIVREALAEHGGDEVKTMGDGFMASFGSVTKAVECAIALQRAFAERESDEPLSVRVGINAGEPIEEDGDLFGATVILASRIAAKAEGGEILVADTVRGLCSGKGFLFADRGEFVAKGFEDPVRLFAVRGQD